jgi:hypothetical protein
MLVSDCSSLDRSSELDEEAEEYESDSSLLSSILFLNKSLGLERNQNPLILDEL